MFSCKTLNICCRIITKTRIEAKLFSQSKSLYISHHIKNVSTRIKYLGYRTNSLPLFNVNSVRYASTESAIKSSDETSQSNVSEDDKSLEIPEPPTIPLESDIAEVIGEASLESYGLGGYSPIGLSQSFIFWIHSTLGIPWWATIIIGTIGLKTLLFPIFLRIQRHQALMRFYHKDLSRFERRKQEALDDGDNNKYHLLLSKQEKFYESHNIMKSKESLIQYVIQGSVFFTFFISIHGMARVPVKSMKDGGLWWFTDLTVADPYYILPLITATSTGLFLALHPMQELGVKMKSFKKHLIYILPLLTLPIILNLKTSLLLYIITSMWFTFLSQVLLRIPKLRAFYKVAPLVKLDPNPTAQKTDSIKDMIEFMKESWRDIRHSRATSAAYLLDQKKFVEAGRGALVKTYKFDPTKNKPPHGKAY